MIRFEWSHSAQSAFDRLKTLFTSAPIPSPTPDPSKQFIVEVDASEVGVGAILSQRSSSDGKIHPCAFYSHRLSPSERNYDVGNRELLAIRLALGEWRHWLEGSPVPFVVWTDHINLEYIRTEGIKLNLDKIEFNAARRSIMKLLLNSLWGRFSMREELPTTEILTDPEQFARYIFGTEYDIKHFSFVSDTVAIVQWAYAYGKGTQTRDINVFLGAFTTAHARLELYDLMDRLGDRLLYCDTDSVVFTSKEGEYEPPLGPYLGDLTDEVGDGDHIVEFSASGPKSYGYRTAKGKVCMKAKGITLNAVNSETIRLDTLIGLVDQYVRGRGDSNYILAYTDSIVRNKKQFTLHNKSVVKKFKVVYNKRVLLPDLTTLPYGY
jgi:hypothetical protein